jgi:hypothetical protein
MWHAWERRKVYGILVGKPERDHSEDQGIDGRLRIGTGDRLLQTQ